MKTQPVRTLAVRICHAVIYKRQHLTEALQEKVPKQANAEYRSALKSLCFETIRHEYWLRDIWQQCVSKTPKDKVVRVIMSIALCEKIFHHKANHVVVNEAINSAKLLKKRWASGLINATLRNAIQQHSSGTLVSSSASAEYAHPTWWIERLRKDWPQHWQNMLTANNRKPPLWVRAQKNTTHLDQSQPHNDIGSAHRIAAQDITKHPLFISGDISVQDASAQLAAHILDPKDGEKILDACAAPGGKTGHLLEVNANIQLDAIELYPNRAKKIQDNLRRIKHSANVIVADAKQWRQWFNEPPYQKILLDAPCSASGIVRRQPDIKFLRNPDDLTNICQDQQQLLSSMADILAPGGHLLYATCSVFAQENAEQISLFLQTHPEFSEIALQYPFAINVQHGIQILPGEQDMDGFYYCFLKKNDV